MNLQKLSLQPQRAHQRQQQKFNKLAQQHQLLLVENNPSQTMSSFYFKPDEFKIQIKTMRQIQMCII